VKTAYYCQHVLGVGHFHRSLEICRACAADSDVTMVVGGPPIDMSSEPFSFYQLPGLKMDEQFSTLMPCDPHASLTDIQEIRSRELVSFFQRFAPDALVVELFPFGRKAFRFELLPLLEAARQSRCRVICSLRDILVEKKQEQLKHERNAVKTLNRYFDMLLVHSDPRLATLDETFSLFEQITVPIHYTGFVTPLPARDSRHALRESLSIRPQEKLIVASIGSGSVGSELLQAVHETAHTMVEESPYHFNFFAGPYCDEAVFESLSATTHERIHIHRFTDTFVDWLAAADLSISMAGYNTSMNVLAAGVPALMMPFDQNREQRMRLTKLTDGHPMAILEKEDLQPQPLAKAIRRQLAEPRYRTSLMLDGAARTARFLQSQT